jgi:hypothetical protein
MTATFLPLVSFTASGLILFSLDQSATKRSNLPMETASPRIALIHLASHCTSCGQTLPHTAGSAEYFPIILDASSILPFSISLINPGISIETGHPRTHFAF